MLFPAVRWMSWALTVLPLTVMSSLAMTAAVLPAVIRLPFVSSVMVSAWSFHPVLPRLIFIPTALFLLMTLSVFRFSVFLLRSFLPARHTGLSAGRLPLLRLFLRERLHLLPHICKYFITIINYIFQKNYYIQFVFSTHHSSRKSNPTLLHIFHYWLLYVRKVFFDILLYPIHSQ